MPAANGAKCLPASSDNLPQSPSAASAQASAALAPLPPPPGLIKQKRLASVGEPGQGGQRSGAQLAFAIFGTGPPADLYRGDRHVWPCRS